MCVTVDCCRAPSKLAMDQINSLNSCNRGDKWEADCRREIGSGKHFKGTVIKSIDLKWDLQRINADALLLQVGSWKHLNEVYVCMRCYHRPIKLCESVPCFRVLRADSTSQDTNAGRDRGSLLAAPCTRRATQQCHLQADSHNQEAADLRLAAAAAWCPAPGRGPADSSRSRWHR